MFIAGRPRPGSLPVVPAPVQPERAGVHRDLHADRDARDAGVRRPGGHERVHHDPLDGHEDCARR